MDVECCPRQFEEKPTGPAKCLDRTGLSAMYLLFYHLIMMTFPA